MGEEKKYGDYTSANGEKYRIEETKEDYLKKKYVLAPIAVVVIFFVGFAGVILFDIWMVAFQPDYGLRRWVLFSLWVILSSSIALMMASGYSPNESQQFVTATILLFLLLMILL